MPLNHYVSLGKSGLRVSPLCLGAMTFGLEWGWGSSPEDSHKIIQEYVDRGGNFIDTANVYTKGHSEVIVGDYINKKGFRRDQLVIATKFFGTLYPGDPNAGGAGRKAIYSQLEASMRRLNTDYIDLYWMHCWDTDTPIEETMSTLDDLVRSGKVRYIGFSDTPAWKCAQAQMLACFRNWTKLIALQIEYSLLERTVEGELIPMAEEYQLGVTPWSPLKSGALTGKYTRQNAGKVEPGRGDWVKSALTDKTYDVIDTLVEVSKQAKATPSQVAIAWLLTRPAVVSPIIGARTMDQLKDNLGSLDVKLTPEQLAKLEEVSAPVLNFPAQFVRNAGPFKGANTTINGRTNPESPLAPKSDSERWDRTPVGVR